MRLINSNASAMLEQESAVPECLQRVYMRSPQPQGDSLYRVATLVAALLVLVMVGWF